MNKLRSLTHEFIIALVCSRALTSSSRAESAWMEFFELIIFEGINEMNSEADSFSIWKISRNLDFRKFLWKIKGTENSEPTGFSSCWRKLGKLTTWGVKISCLRKISWPGWYVYSVDLRNCFVISKLSRLKLIFPSLHRPHSLFSFNNYSISRIWIMSSSRPIVVIWRR